MVDIDADSKAGTMKFEKFKETTGENTGRYSNSKGVHDSTRKQDTKISVRMNDSDIKIVTLPPKDRVLVSDQKNDALKITA